MKRIRAVASIALLVTACGGPKQDASAPSNLDVPKLASSAPAKPAVNATPHDVSESIRRHWPFDERIKGALYADVDAMMKMDLFRALAQAPEEKCLDEVLRSAKEIAIGFDDRGVIAIGRFGDPFPEASLRACIAKTDDKKLTLAFAPPLAFLGDPKLVEAAVSVACTHRRNAFGRTVLPTCPRSSVDSSKNKSREETCSARSRRR